MDGYYDDGTPKPRNTITLSLTEEQAEEILVGLAWRCQQKGMGSGQAGEIRRFGETLGAAFGGAGVLPMMDTFNNIMRTKRVVTVKVASSP